MAFGVQLKDALQHRETMVPAEFAKGEALGTVLTRCLVAVEAAADTEMLTSILLLDGNRLRHGAAPNLPPSYCSAIDGAEIGPSAGSCGTAAYCGHPIYVADIAEDPLWVDYRDLALQHGLRACWSTPITNDAGTVVGTFAIYHLTPRSPTREEVQAIRTVTDHVARAIAWSARAPDAPTDQQKTASARLLRLVANADEDQISFLHVSRDFEALVAVFDVAIAKLAAIDPDDVQIAPLRRARAAAAKGVALARSGPSPD